MWLARRGKGEGENVESELGDEGEGLSVATVRGGSTTCEWDGLREETGVVGMIRAAWIGVEWGGC
jgi:hypothetical protein